MGYASGVYTGAEIMMLDTANGIQSGGSAGDSETSHWSLSWNTEGFIGQGWFKYGKLSDAAIEASAYEICLAVHNLVPAECADIV